MSDPTVQRKQRKCMGCGAKYPARALCCPRCFEPNPELAPPPLSRNERLFGMVLLGAGLALGLVLYAVIAFVPQGVLAFAPIAAPRAGIGILAFIALGMAFHGVLFLCGIHPKDFYGWWNSLSDVGQKGLIGMGILLAVLFIYLTFFAG